MRYLLYEGHTHPHRVGPEDKTEFKLMVIAMPVYQAWCEKNIPSCDWQIDWNSYHAIFFKTEEQAIAFKLAWDNTAPTDSDDVSLSLAKSNRYLIALGRALQR